MKRLLLWITFITILYFSWPIIEKQPAFIKLTQSENTAMLAESLRASIEKLQLKILEISNEGSNEKLVQIEKPALSPPEKQVFSIYNIKLGDDQKNVEQQFGKPARSSLNEYGTLWHTYHKSYQNFFMVAYDQNQKVSALFTNQDLIASQKGIKFGSSREAVLQQLGNPLTKLQKGYVFYQLQKDSGYDVFLRENNYLTVFYDKHKNNTVTALQVMNKSLEDSKKELYAKASPQIKESFELQLFDLTNASRTKFGLMPLVWDDRIKETARKHSQDMAVNGYFGHTNRSGESPFDRMKKDGILFSVAGENLAYGQASSIFANEGLMNSEGHRKNILQADFKRLGVGVSFNSENQPFYTENFYTQR